MEEVSLISRLGNGRKCFYSIIIISTSSGAMRKRFASISNTDGLELVWRPKIPEGASGSTQHTTRWQTPFTDRWMSKTNNNNTLSQLAPTRWDRLNCTPLHWLHLSQDEGNKINNNQLFPLGATQESIIT